MASDRDQSSLDAVMQGHVAVSLNCAHPQARQTKQRLHTTSIMHQRMLGVVIWSNFGNRTYPGTFTTDRAPSACMAWPPGLPGERQLADARCRHCRALEFCTPLSPRPSVVDAPIVYQARHSWGRHCSWVSDDLFPTKDARALCSGVAPQPKATPPSISRCSAGRDKWFACVCLQGMGSRRPGAPCHNVCTQTHGSAPTPSAGSCWSAVKATGGQRTCRPPAHWVRLPHLIAHGIARHLASGPVASPGSSSRRAQGKRAAGFHQRPGCRLTTAAHAASR
jgi:hypothetical protein